MKVIFSRIDCYIILCCERVSDDKSAQLYLYCEEENPEMFLVPPPLDRVLQHVALFIIFLNIAKPQKKHNHNVEFSTLVDHMSNAFMKCHTVFSISIVGD